ncbi:MAG: hypothetical protein IKQ31_01675 [Clostridia bacterium]|nr:hypothetical protein [Clostridia bacterium]
METDYKTENGKAFDEVIKNIDKLNVPPKWKETIKNGLTKYAKFVDIHPDIKLDFHKFFEEHLYGENGLKFVIDDEELKSLGDAGCFTPSTNTITLKTRNENETTLWDEQTFVHEFTHFIIYNAYKAYFESLPIYYNEALTDTLASQIIGREYSGAYQEIIEFVKILNKLHSPDKTSNDVDCVPFLNGELPEFLNIELDSSTRYALEDFTTRKNEKRYDENRQYIAEFIFNKCPQLCSDPIVLHSCYNKALKEYVFYSQLDKNIIRYKELFPIPPEFSDSYDELSAILLAQKELDIASFNGNLINPKITQAFQLQHTDKENSKKLWIFNVSTDNGPHFYSHIPYKFTDDTLVEKISKQEDKWGNLIYYKYSPDSKTFKISPLDSAQLKVSEIAHTPDELNQYIDNLRQDLVPNDLYVQMAKNIAHRGEIDKDYIRVRLEEINNYIQFCNKNSPSSQCILYCGNTRCKNREEMLSSGNCYKYVTPANLENDSKDLFILASFPGEKYPTILANTNKEKGFINFRMDKILNPPINDPQKKREYLGKVWDMEATYAQKQLLNTTEISPQNKPRAMG